MSGRACPWRGSGSGQALPRPGPQLQCSGEEKVVPQAAGFGMPVAGLRLSESDAAQALALRVTEPGLPTVARRKAHF